MSKKSQVHIFTSEPIGEKPVTDLSGIGPTIGKRLADKGFDKVCVSYNMDFELQSCIYTKRKGI